MIKLVEGWILSYSR